MEKCAMEKAMDIIRETMTTMDKESAQYKKDFDKLQDLLREHEEITEYLNSWVSFHYPSSSYIPVPRRR